MKLAVTLLLLFISQVFVHAELQVLDAAFTDTLTDGDPTDSNGSDTVSTPENDSDIINSVQDSTLDYDSSAIDASSSQVGSTPDGGIEDIQIGASNGDQLIYILDFVRHGSRSPKY